VIPALLEALLRAVGPSGHEAPVAAVFREAVREVGELGGDRLGSCWVRVPGDDGPTLAVLGHLDEIALLVAQVRDDGLLRVVPVASWDPPVLLGQRVEVHGGGGVVPGVVGRAPIHLLKQDPAALEAPLRLRDLLVDVGAGDRAGAEALVAVGDPVVVTTPGPVLLAGGRVAARALDDRVGCYVALEVARRVAEAGGGAGDLLAVGTVQEESSGSGARTAAAALQPDLAVAVDVTPASDVPGVDPGETGEHPLGSGPVLTRGPRLDEGLAARLAAIARARAIAVTVEAAGGDTGTDADEVQQSGTGVPSAALGVPLRYLHSPVELVDLADVERAVQLLVGLALGEG
jgi:endoglucanase